jgi:5-methylcytosine-specific restriction endonuclease McrA
MTFVACIVPRCSQPALDRARGRCARHRQTTTSRGYGPEWRRLRAEAIARQPYCTTCGSRQDLTADHIVPLALGGLGTRSNVQVLCRPCNSRKRDRLPAYHPMTLDAATAARRRTR